MKKNALTILFCLIVMMSACASPAPADTDATLASTEVPSESATDTPEPTTTPVPEPQTITVANAADLSFQGLGDLPRKPNLVWPYVIYTGDSQHVVVITETGVDVLNAKTLELETSYSGLQVEGSVIDGRLYGWQDDKFVFVDPESGEITPMDFNMMSGGVYAVTFKGDKLAYTENDTTVQIMELASGESTPITIASAEGLGLFFGADGSVLIAASYVDDESYTAYDVNTGEQLYKKNSWLFFSDEERVITFGPGWSLEFYDIVTNELLSTRAAEEDVVKSGYLTPNGYDKPYNVQFYDFLDNKNQALVLYQEYIIPSRFGVYDLETHTPVYILPEGDDVTTLKDLYDGPFASPDESTFTILWPDGGLELFDLASGESLALSDRYTIASKMAISPDGSLIAWSTYQELNVYNLQTGEFVLQAEHPKPVVEFGTLSFIGQSKLLVSALDAVYEQQPWGLSEIRNIRTYIWDMSSGSVELEHLVLYNCEPQGSDEQFMKCGIFENAGNYAPETFIGTSIFDITNPNNVVVSGGSEAFLAGSPSNDGFSICKDNAPGIAIKEGTAPTLNLPHECQPFFYEMDGDTILLYLQNGAVIDVATGETRLQLDVDETGIAFESEFTMPRKAPDFSSYEPYYSGIKPKLINSDGFIVINNRVFDSQSGKLLVELTGMDYITGVTMSDDGKTLILLTNRGLEHWQVLQ